MAPTAWRRTVLRHTAMLSGANEVQNLVISLNWLKSYESTNVLLQLLLPSRQERRIEAAEKCFRGQLWKTGPIFSRQALAEALVEFCKLGKSAAHGRAKVDRVGTRTRHCQVVDGIG